MQNSYLLRVYICALFFFLRFVAVSFARFSLALFGFFFFSFFLIRPIWFGNAINTSIFYASARCVLFCATQTTTATHMKIENENSSVAWYWSEWLISFRLNSFCADISTSEPNAIACDVCSRAFFLPLNHSQWDRPSVDLTERKSKRSNRLT